MPLDITPTEAAKIYNSPGAITARLAMQKRADYYDGKHAILKRSERYADGTEKSNRVANWVRYIINRYVGLLSSTPYQITAKDELVEAAWMATYGDIAEANHLQQVDVEHLRTALIKGCSVEVHGWANGLQTIDASDPAKWAFIKDERGQNVGAISMDTIEAGTFYGGAVLTEPLKLMTIYDDVSIRVYKQSQAPGATIEWSLVSEVRHEFSRLPVIQVRVNGKAESAITDAIIGLSDEYNEIFSTAGDDVRREVDALLKITGHDPKWILEHAREIRENRTLPLGEGADAGYIQRSSDTAPTVQHLTRTREAIHMSGEVPDVEQIVGVTGGTSGIALQLKFLPMLQNTNAMIVNIKAAIRERIDLINDRLSILRKPIIERYDVIVQVSLPTNRVEEWQNIGALKDIVSHKKQLELLSDVDNPEQELRRLEREAEANASRILTPEDAVAVKDARVTQGAVAAEGDFETLVSTLSTALVEHMMSSGGFDNLMSNAE